MFSGEGDMVKGEGYRQVKKDEGKYCFKELQRQGCQIETQERWVGELRNVSPKVGVTR